MERDGRCFGSEEEAMMMIAGRAGSVGRMTLQVVAGRME